MTTPTPFSASSLFPQPEVLEKTSSKKKLRIGIPKEKLFEEKRICLTPESAELLINNGHEIVMESGAGEGSYFPDNEYSEVGVEIVYDSQTPLKQPIVLKVEPPTLDEIHLMNQNALLFSTLQLGLQNKDFFTHLKKKAITAIAFDFIEDEKGEQPVVKTIGEIAGIHSIMVAAELLANTRKGSGILLGNIPGVPPCEVVIIGAGVVGQKAAETALKLGASVKVFDHSVNNLRNLQNRISAPIFTSLLDQKAIKKALMRCNVAIGAVGGTGRTPCIVPTELIQMMKKGSVIIDISIDSGGCFETSKIGERNDSYYEVFDVKHYCVTNISSRVSRTATKALSNFFAPYFLKCADQGGFELLAKSDLGFRKGIYMYKGVLTKKSIGNWFDLPFQEIDLLIF